MSDQAQTFQPMEGEYGGDALPTPAIAVTSIILSLGVLAIANGLMFAFIPLRLSAEGFSPTWAGSILTALAAGGMAACFMTGHLVRRVGHARVFMTLTAIIILSNAVIGMETNPYLWLVARMLYGFAMNGLFIVAQSWLNDVLENDIRGRVLAIFYVTYVVALGVGSYGISYIDISGNTAPVIGVVFAAISIIPVGLTRLRPPPPPETASIALNLAWQVSPVGVAGMLAVGGLSVMVAGFAPIHAAATGLTQSEIALLMFAMPLGTILIQVPFGWLSDRMDRRYMMVAAGALVFLGGLLAARADGGSILLLLAVYMIWSGATETIFSLSSAHAGDRAQKKDLVSVSSTLLFAWSLSGFIIPGGTTVLTAVVGTQAFMYVAIFVALLLVAFIIWRIRIAEATPADETVDFAPLPAQAPLPAELAYEYEVEDEEEFRAAAESR